MNDEKPLFTVTNVRKPSTETASLDFEDIAVRVQSKIANYAEALFESEDLSEREKLLVSAIWVAGLKPLDELNMYIQVELMVKLNGIENALRERGI